MCLVLTQSNISPQVDAISEVGIIYEALLDEYLTTVVKTFQFCSVYLRLEVRKFNILQNWVNVMCVKALQDELRDNFWWIFHGTKIEWMKWKKYFVELFCDTFEDMKLNRFFQLIYEKWKNNSLDFSYVIQAQLIKVKY